MKKLRTISQLILESLNHNELKAMLEKEPDQKFVDWINTIAKENKIDITGIDLKQLAVGMEVEKEHDSNDDIDVVKSDVDLLKISVAHLREDEQYYTVLLDSGL